MAEYQHVICNLQTGEVTQIPLTAEEVQAVVDAAFAATTEPDMAAPTVAEKLAAAGIDVKELAALLQSVQVT
jgi:type II secretory pathway component PulM